MKTNTEASNALNKKFKSFFNVTEDGLVKDLFRTLEDQEEYLLEYGLTLENLDDMFYDDFLGFEDNFSTNFEDEYEFDIKPFWENGMSVWEIVDQLTKMTDAVNTLRAMNTGKLLGDRVDEYIWDNLDKVAMEAVRSPNLKYLYTKYQAEVLSEEIDFIQLMGIIRLKLTEQEGGQNG